MHSNMDLSGASQSLLTLPLTTKFISLGGQSLFCNISITQKFGDPEHEITEYGTMEELSVYHLLGLKRQYCLDVPDTQTKSEFDN